MIFVENVYREFNNRITFSHENDVHWRSHPQDTVRRRGGQRQLTSFQLFHCGTKAGRYEQDYGGFSRPSFPMIDRLDRGLYARCCGFLDLIT
jgi:hypothetical protein